MIDDEIELVIRALRFLDSSQQKMSEGPGSRLRPEELLKGKGWDRGMLMDLETRLLKVSQHREFSPAGIVPKSWWTKKGPPNRKRRSLAGAQGQTTD